MMRLIAAAVAALISMLGTACSPDEQPTDAETWAFCGVSPHDPYADAKTKSLSQDANIDATFGPCLAPDWSTYTTYEPGVRYQSPADYMRTVKLNAKYDMATVVYDARVWSTDATVRAQAIAYWQPVIKWVRAWDMGDEFSPDPSLPDWSILITRWGIVQQYVTPSTGVGPFTNHVPWALDQALRDLPGAGAHLSYDQYDVSASLDTAATYNLRASHLMCSINTLDHGDFHPESQQVINDMQLHRDAGCDSFLIFGGDMPFNTPGFNTPSLVTPTGTPTPLAEAVAKGAQ